MKKTSGNSSPPPRRNANSALPPTPPPAPHRDWQQDWWWLVVPAFIASCAWWYLLSRILGGHPSFGSLTWQGMALLGGLGLLTLGMASGMMLFAAYLIRSRWWQGLVALVLAAPLLFFHGVNLWSIAAYLVCVVGWWAGAWAVEKEVISRVDVHPWSSLQSGTSIAVLGLTTAMALLFGLSVTAGSLTPAERVAQLVGQTVGLVEKFAQSTYPAIHAEMTIDQAIGTQLPSAEKVLTSIGISDRLTAQEQPKLQQALNSYGIDQSIPTGTSRAELEKKLQSLFGQYEQQAVSQVRNELGKQFKIPLRGTETVDEALRTLVYNQVSGPALRYANLFGVVASVAAWLILRIFAPFLQWAAILCGWCWYRVLRALHLAHIGRRMEEVEHLEWGKG